MVRWEHREALTCGWPSAPLFQANLDEQLFKNEVVKFIDHERFWMLEEARSCQSLLKG